MKQHKKHMRIFLVLVLALTLCIPTGCDSDETHTCAQCNKTTTEWKKYTTDKGTELYYCKECRETCFYCGEKASEHYTDPANDKEIFVCKKCYTDIVEGN